MTYTPEQLLNLLESLDIKARTHHHEPLFTVAESQHLRGQIPGCHCKSLFLQDKNKNYWLVVMREEVRANLKGLAAACAASKFSFAKPEALRTTLGVEPGSVTPFGLINNPERTVTVVLDSGMLACDLVNYHPLDNRMTTTLASGDLLKFISHCGHVVHHIDMETL